MFFIDKNLTLNFYKIVCIMSLLVSVYGTYNITLIHTIYILRCIAGAENYNELQVFFIDCARVHVGEDMIRVQIREK